jgi:hypothetical protein
MQCNVAPIANVHMITALNKIGEFVTKVDHTVS